LNPSLLLNREGITITSGEYDLIGEADIGVQKIYEMSAPLEDIHENYLG